MRASESLRRAKQTLIAKGWHQGSFRGRDGSVCIAMALPNERYHVTCAFLCEAIGIGMASLSEWNDEQGRTIEDIHEALDLAITLAQQQEAEVPA